MMKRVLSLVTTLVIGTNLLYAQSVEQGRKYVAAYVQYTHLVEGIHNAIIAAASHDQHKPESPDHAASPQDSEHQH